MQPGLLLAAIWVASSSSSGELRATAAPAAHGAAVDGDPCTAWRNIYSPDPFFSSMPCL